MQVALRGRQVAVAQELRERGQIDAGLEQMGGEGVAQRVDAALLTAVDSRTNPASTAGTAQHDLDLVSG